MRLVVALLASTCAFLALAQAARADAVWSDGIEVIDDSELSDLRGGFAVGGYDINFGAVVTTYIDGTPALATNVTWTDAGQVVNQTIGAAGQSIADMTPEQRNAFGLGELDHAGGVVITDASGMTALIHNVANGALQNILINSASGRDITQNVDVTITLPGFKTIQGDISLQRFGIGLAEDIANSATPRS